MRIIFFLGLTALAPALALASGGETAGHDFAQLFLWISILLLAAKFASFVEVFKQPAVLGELLIGVVLGNLVLFGVPWFAPIAADPTILFLAELGVVVLLFQTGLESQIQRMRAVGLRALSVAIIGVVLPFLLGTYVVGPLFFGDLPYTTHLFLGAALTATSVGITARVFKDLGKLQLPEAQIVLGAAVIDDILGLILLAIISGIVVTGAVTFTTVGIITSEAVLFLVGAIALGQLIAPRLSRFFSKISTGIGMKFTLVITFGLIFAYLADLIGLAPIVGAFAAGLILDPVHFRYFKDPRIVHDVRRAVSSFPEKERTDVLRTIEPHAERQLEDLIEPLGYFLVPIFFVITGMNVRLDAFLNPYVVGVSLIITAVAIIGKVASGLAAGPVRKSLVGWGMVPRGEVGLIFATIGRSLGAVNDEVFSIIVVVIILTTLISPPLLSWQLRRTESAA